MRFGQRAIPGRLDVHGQTIEQELPAKIGHIGTNQTIAEEHGLSLIAHEAGQHFAGIGKSVTLDAGLFFGWGFSVQGVIEIRQCTSGQSVRHQNASKRQ